MKLKNNLIYSAILTLSIYLVPLLVFPYISRVLGVERIGMIDTADNIIDYCILFFLNAATTLLAFCLLWVAYYSRPQLQGKGELLLIGSVKLVFNLFWIAYICPYVMLGLFAILSAIYTKQSVSSGPS